MRTDIPSTRAARVRLPSQRASVCDTSTLGTAGLESNCVAYPSGVYKPQGLIQQYSNQIKYAVIGYLNLEAGASSPITC